MTWRKLPHLTVSLLALFFLLFASAQASNPHKFDALGGSWLATDITWVEIDREWLVKTVIRAAREPDQTLTVPQVLIASCEEILHSTPNSPNSGVTRTNIFRVDLNIIAANNRPAYRVTVPIPVDNGKCIITNELHSPT